MSPTTYTPFELLFDQLRDLHSMEVQLGESMHELVPLCTNDELRELIVNHVHQNCDQIVEIAAIFERHGESTSHAKCKTISGLIERGTAQLEAVRCPHTRDLMMIAHCLRIEYHEMAAYEFTTLLSARMGLMREPEILNELRAEEKDMATALMVLESDVFEAVTSHAGASYSTTTDSRLYWWHSRLAG